MHERSYPDKVSTILDVFSWLCLCLMLVFFWGLKSFSFKWEAGDEAIYLYMSWAAFDHGAIPYKDYFFAHPPFQLVWALPFFALFGFNPVAAKAIPLLATSLTAIFIFLICKEKIGRVASVSSAFLFLTAFSLLRSTTFWTGVHESILLAVLGLWFFLRKKPTWAGICLALGVCTGTYILPAAVLIGALARVDERETLRKYGRSFLGVWGTTQIAGLILGGSEYLRSVYLFHFRKPEAKQSAWRDTIQHFFMNFSLFWIGLNGFWLALLERKNKLSTPTKKRNPFFMIRLKHFIFDDERFAVAFIGGAWTVGYLVFLHLLKKRFSFYYHMVFPGLALCSGYLAQQVFEWVLVSIHHLRSRLPLRWNDNLAFRLLIIFFILGGYALYRPSYEAFSPGAFRKKDQEMKWRDSPLPIANGFFKWCCWDSIALADVEYGNPQEILYRNGDFFRPLTTLSNFVAKNSSPRETLFGDSITVGLVAILSNRRLEKDFADTNTMRFTSKITPAEEAIRIIDSPSLKYVLVAAQKNKGGDGYFYHRFAGVPTFRKWLDANFKLALEVPTGKNRSYLLLERK
ncbi:MAG: hypothetical protein EBQ92_09550, partial [Proteobacteria bacterium]|nr:hypothetical protein [Pseudomonadota bacterium]